MLFLNKPLIIVQLKGGLGNQMFQYATARGINNGRGNILIDLSYFKNNRITTDEVTAKNLEINVFKKLPIKCLNYSSSNYVYRLIRKFFSKYCEVIQKENEFVPVLKNLKRSLYLEGYYQSEKYFAHIRNSLLTEFEFPLLDPVNSNICGKINSSFNAVSLHVRRGDYLKPNALNYIGLLPLDYYLKAISIIQEKYPNPFYFVFSDDPEWCAENFEFLGSNYFIVKGNDGANAWKDMFLMSNCKHHILANSSFSWWGAWLSSKNGLKLAPKYWLNPKVANYSIDDFVPDQWTVVDYKNN